MPALGEQGEENPGVIISNDDRVGKKPAHERPAAPRYREKTKRVATDSPLGRQANPHGDPNVRVCDNGDGSVTVIHADPAPGKRAFVDDSAEDQELFPC